MKRNCVVHVRWASYNFIDDVFEGIAMNITFDKDISWDERTDVKEGIKDVRYNDDEKK